MNPQSGLGTGRVGSAACAALLLGLTAVGLPAQKPSSRGGAPQAVSSPLTLSTAQYALETWFEIRPGAAPSFDAHAAARRAFGPRIPNGIERWVDSRSDTGGRVVTVPARTLAELGRERNAEAGLESLMGEQAYRALVSGFREAQLAGASYLRRYRHDLSQRGVGVARDALWATEVTQVTLATGRVREFPSLWKTALSAYGRVLPNTEYQVAETLVGGGPQFVVLRPLRSEADRQAWLHPADAVERASGTKAGEQFRRRFASLVQSWEPVLLERTQNDAAPGPRPSTR